MLPLQNFISYVQQNALFTTDNRILLAVSGGKDSVLMAHFFKQAGFKIGIAHCNFGLRAAESQRDEHFVRMLAALLEVPLYVTHFETKAYAALHKVSTQMAARELRYQWFEEIRTAEKYDCIAVAQHQDDAMETVLLNLVRGTGIAGLHGILPKRDRIVRPLLFLSRAAIDELLTAEGIEFVEDSSNLSTAYARNKLRLDVIPLLKEINPNLEHTFEQNIQRFAETELILQQAVAEQRKNICEKRNDGLYIRIEKIAALNPQRLLLFELLKPYGFTENVTSEVLDSLDKQSGTSFYSPGYRLTIDREEIIISPFTANFQPLNHNIHPADRVISLNQQQVVISYSDIVGYKNDLNMAFVDAAQLIFPLLIRTWQEGDRFMPIGMKNYKKMSDFFIDQKIPVPRKEAIPILINGNGEVIWVVGLRQDNRYKVTTTTKKVAIFEQKFN